MSEFNSGPQPPASEPPRPPAPEFLTPPAPEPTQAPAPPPPPPPAWWSTAPTKRRSPARRVLTYFGVLILLLSILVNIYLVIVLAALSSAGMAEAVVKDGDDDQVVAIYAINGTIDPMTSAVFRSFYGLVRDREDIKAVVIAVDSPGGYVAPSDEIYRMIRNIRDKLKRPVVVSMGGTAASGGYYVSAPATSIYAEPTTITGSIGVIGAWVVAKEFLEKHGVKPQVIRARQCQRWKAAVNPLEQPDAEVLLERQKLLDHVHDRFAKVVRECRGEKLKTRAVEVTVRDFDGKQVTRQQTEPLNGRVYSADDAKALGLVDQIGYLDEAADKAAQLAGLDRPKVVQYARRISLRERLGVPDVASGLDAESIREAMAPRMMMLWDGL